MSVGQNEDDESDQSVSVKINIFGAAITFSGVTFAIVMLLVMCNVFLCFALIKMRRQQKVAHYAPAKMVDSDVEMCAVEKC